MKLEEIELLDLKTLKPQEEHKISIKCLYINVVYTVYTVKFSIYFETFFELFIDS